MTLDDFYSFYKTQLFGKIYCFYKEVEDEYHYERVHKGYDHLGSLGYDDVKVVDSYKKTVIREKINKRNVIAIARNILNGKGWLEDGNGVSEVRI